MGSEARQTLNNSCGSTSHNYLEYALDYGRAGLYDEAAQLLLELVESQPAVYPIVYYCLAYFYDRLGQTEQSAAVSQKSDGSQSGLCVSQPARRTDCVAMGRFPTGLQPRPHALLPRQFLVRQPAISRKPSMPGSSRPTLDDTFPTVFRNLSLAYQNKLQRSDDALRMLEKAFCARHHRCAGADGAGPVVQKAEPRPRRPAGPAGKTPDGHRTAG